MAQNENVVIDCDSHVMEPGDLWERYLEPRYRDRAIKVVDVDGFDQLVVDDQVLLPMGLAGLGGVNIEPRSRLRTDLSLRYVDGCPLASYEPAARARMLDEWGVDRGVLFPTIGILPLPVQDPGLLNAYARAYNTWQAEFFQEIPDRVIPIALLNLADLDAATEELERCLDLGFRGVFLPPETAAGHKPGSPHFDPLWERCAEAGVPLCMHVIVRFGGPAVPFASWHEAGANMLFSFALGAPGQLMPCLTSMITDGVFDRIPELKVLCVEAGAGWAPYLMDRLDEKAEFFADSLVPPLQLKASDYIRRNCWFVAEPAERTIGTTLDLVGEDRVLWGSDYPHIDSTMAAPELIRDSLADLDPRRRNAVLGGNAARLFGLG